MKINIYRILCVNPNNQNVYRLRYDLNSNQINYLAAKTLHPSYNSLK